MKIKSKINFIINFKGNINLIIFQSFNQFKKIYLSVFKIIQKYTKSNYLLIIYLIHLRVAPNQCIRNYER